MQRPNGRFPAHSLRFSHKASCLPADWSHLEGCLGGGGASAEEGGRVGCSSAGGGTPQAQKLVLEGCPHLCHRRQQPPPLLHPAHSQHANMTFHEQKERVSWSAIPSCSFTLHPAHSRLGNTDSRLSGVRASSSASKPSGCDLICYEVHRDSTR